MDSLGNAQVGFLTVGGSSRLAGRSARALGLRSEAHKATWDLPELGAMPADDGPGEVGR